MAKILCVDDEPNIVTLKCAILEAAGHQVTPSTSAHDAIEKLTQNTYDAVVTDWRLGDANGRSIVQAAKTHSTMPVVVVSGYVAEAFQAAEPLADGTEEVAQAPCGAEGQLDEWFVALVRRATGAARVHGDQGFQGLAAVMDAAPRGHRQAMQQPGSHIRHQHLQQVKPARGVAERGVQLGTQLG